MDWQRDLPTWPNHALSRRVRCRPHEWHVQEAGSGRTLLLLHGAGASVHTWRDLVPALASDHHVVALDLPGQGFSRAGSRGRLGLRPMVEDIAALAAAQGWQPQGLIGHSAGGALALALSEVLQDPDGGVPRVIGLNAALGRFEGVAGWLFPILARLLALNPLTPHLFTLGGRSEIRARRLIEGTGSRLDAEGLACYARLIADRSHVDATLRMMAQWDIGPLTQRLTDLRCRCHFIAGARDRAVPPKVSRDAARGMRHATVEVLPGLGHLAHEEDPAGTVRRIRAAMGETAAAG